MRTIYTLLLWILPFFIYSQTPDTLLANQYLEEARSLFKENKDSKKSVALAYKALSIFEKQPQENPFSLAYTHFLLSEMFSYTDDYKKTKKHLFQAKPFFEKHYPKGHAKWVHLYAYLGDSYAKASKQDSAAFYFETALPFVAKLSNSNHTKNNFYNDYGLHLELNAEYDKAIEYFKKSIETFPSPPGNKENNISRQQGNIGMVLGGLKKHKEAIKWNEKSIETQKKIGAESTLDMAKSYLSLGLNHKNLADYNTAIIYYHKGVTILQKIGSEETITMGHLFNNLGICYKRIKDYPKALEYYEKARKVYAKIHSEEHPAVADLYTNIGNIHRQRKEWDKALYQYNKALTIRKKVLDPYHPRMAINNAVFGLVYQDKGEYAKAISYFQNALEISKKGLGEKHPMVANGYTSIAYNYEELGELDKARAYHLSAFKVLDYYPEKGNRFNLVNVPNYLFTSLNELARVSRKQFEQQGNINFLEESLLYAKEAIALTKHMREGFKEAGSTKNLLTNAYEAYQNAVVAATALYNQTENEKYAQEAWQFSEKSKSIILLSFITNSKALQNAALPEDLLNQIKEKDSKITSLEKQIFLAEQEGKLDNDTLLIRLRNNIFDEKESYAQIKEKIQSEYPDYFNLKYADNNSDISSVQENLGNDQALIEYFLTDKEIVVFLVEKENFNIVQIPLDFPLEEWINSFRKGILAYQLANDKTEALYTQTNQIYVETASQLYQKLLAPLGQLPENLIIIPDGIIGYIPFEILLTEKPADAHTFKSHSYVANQHQISYNFSATLLQTMQDKTYGNNRNNFLGFAPSFENEEATYTDVSELRRNNLAPLVFNEQEVNDIQAITAGETITGTDASLHSFKTLANQYKILHFATHAKVNDVDIDYSFLAFNGAHKDSLQTGKAFIKDLYTMQLPSDMVVLSACETGFGTLQKGEGILSLGRGFAYAGAKSLVTSLWSVNDESTAQIMAAFYQYLKNGETKDAALRQAKLDYLAAAENTNAHPFFWGAFVPIGDMETISFASGNMLWTFAIPILFVVFMLIFYLTKK